MVLIGNRSVSIFDRKCEFVWDVNGGVLFKGDASIGSGCKISVAENASLIIGANFRISAHSVLDCNKLIEFGDNCLLSWDVLIMDSDYHHILKDNKIINPTKDIVIGNHVWIGNGVTILKGTYIPDNVIVACRSLITKKVLTPNSVVSGNGRDVVVIKEKVNWEN